MKSYLAQRNFTDPDSKVMKTKAAFPTPEAARKLLYLATQRITREWTAPIRDWAKILNQLAIRFEGRLVL